MTHTNKDDAGTTGPLIEELEEEHSPTSNRASRTRLQAARLRGGRGSNGKSSTRSLKAYGSQSMMTKDHHQRSSGSLIKSNPVDQLNNETQVKPTKQQNHQKKLLTPIN